MAKKITQKVLNMDLIVDTFSTKNFKCIKAGKYRGNAEYVFVQPLHWQLSNNKFENECAELVYQPDTQFKFNGRPLLSLVFELREKKKLKVSLEVGTAFARTMINNPNDPLNISNLALRNNLMNSIGLGTLISTGIFDSTKLSSSCRIFNLNAFFNTTETAYDLCDIVKFENTVNEFISFLKNINTNIDSVKNLSLTINNSKCKQGRNLKHLDTNQFKQMNLTF